MSMELMVKAMKAKVGHPLRKLVLIKLADNASDSGECWPSYQHIADQCEIAKSTVRKHIKALETAGFLTVTHRKGPKGNATNVYTLILSHPRDVPLDATGGMPPDSTPMPRDDTGGMPPRSTPMPCDDTGGMPSGSTGISHSFEPVNEPIKDNTLKLPFDFSSWPALPSAQTMKDWLAVRKAKKSALNQTAVNRLAKHLHSAVAAGYSVEDCIATCATRGWVAFELSWLQNAGVVAGSPLGIATHGDFLPEPDGDFNTEL